MISKADYKFVPVNPDPDFDPEHNRQVIEYTIKRSEQLQRKKQREFNEKLKERTEAMSTYIESVNIGNTNSDVKRYFGQEQLAYLRGYDLMDKLKREKQINPNGQLMKRIDKFYAKTQGKV
jgi:hypothetical protein